MVQPGQLLNGAALPLRWPSRPGPVITRSVSASEVVRPGSAAVPGTPARGCRSNRNVRLPACHHGGAPLAAVAVGPVCVAPASVPTKRCADHGSEKGEAELDRRLPSPRFPEAWAWMRLPRPRWPPPSRIAAGRERTGLRFGRTSDSLLSALAGLAGRANDDRFLDVWCGRSHRRPFRPRILAVKMKAWDSTQGGRGSGGSGLSA